VRRAARIVHGTTTMRNPRPSGGWLAAGAGATSAPGAKRELELSMGSGHLNEQIL
jgi:hypothetical protein